MNFKIIVFLSLFSVSLSAAGTQKKSFAFVLVHGAWHGDWVWFKIENRLQRAGHETIAVNLAGHSIDTTKPVNVTLEQYRDKILNVLDKQTKPVILVAHSMGGIAISAAAEARPEKVAKLVYVTAFLLRNNETLLETAMKDTNSLILPNLIVNQSTGNIDINRTKVRKIFYKKTPNQLVLLANKLITPEPIPPLVTPLSITDTNYGSVERYYIKTTRDKSITPKMQKKMYTKSPCKKVYKIRTDHSPFFSAPDTLTCLLIKIAKQSNNICTSAELKLQQENKTITPMLELSYVRTNYEWEY